jgi:RecJ-like exonuclease
VTEVRGVDGKDWVLFSYCETARLIDKQRGMSVKVRTECETCESTGRVTTVNKWSVDRGTKWQRDFEEHGVDECPDCDGNGYRVHFQIREFPSVTKP